MEALGVLGVNLIHAAFRHRNRLRRFVGSLVENLAPGRVEIDLLKFHGAGFQFVDNRLCALELVQSGLTEAAMFLPDGEVVPAAEVLYKRPVLLLRGSFAPVMNLHLDMLRQARGLFGESLEPSRTGALELFEISMANLLRGGRVDHVDFIDRADALQALGRTVLVSNCAEFHRIASVLRRYTGEPIGIVLSIGLLNELFKEKWSSNLEGGILESFGRLFKNRLVLFVYPWRNRRSGELVDALGFRAPGHLQDLYRYFLGNGMIRAIPCGDGAVLEHTSRGLRRMAAAGDPAWRQFVPAEAQPATERLLRRPSQDAAGGPASPPGGLR
jgi:hypothetical protein